MSDTSTKSPTDLHANGSNDALLHVGGLVRSNSDTSLVVDRKGMFVGGGGGWGGFGGAATFCLIGCSVDVGEG